jgi:hypothetical protein
VSGLFLAHQPLGKDRKQTFLTPSASSLSTFIFLTINKGVSVMYEAIVIGLISCLYVIAGLASAGMLAGAVRQHSSKREAVIVVGRKVTIFQAKPAYIPESPVFDTFMEQELVSCNATPDEAYFPKAGDGNFRGTGLDVFPSHRAHL